MEKRKMKYLLVSLLALSLAGCGCSSGCHNKASANGPRSDTRIVQSAPEVGTPVASAPVQ